jgi:serine/threonine-protein kinase
MDSDAPPSSVPPDFFATDLELDRASRDLDALPVGFLLGSYVITGCIGRGAMATVYRAQHTLLKKAVAVKLMKTALLTSSEARHRFFREARAAAAIKHVHVAAITDMGTASGVPYLVMELLEGIDLERHIEERGALPEAEVIALGLPLIAALAAAHDAGVVHRDLKPANVFLARETGEVVPKLLDFGISKFAEGPVSEDWAATGLDQLMGSPLYLPPEAVLGARELTEKSDQYSLAVVLYECVTGKPPFMHDSLLQLLNAIAGGQFAAPSFVRPDVSVALERAILRAMSVDPAQRFADIRELGRALLDEADAQTLARWGALFDYEPPTNRSLYRASYPRAFAAPAVLPPAIIAPEAASSTAYVESAAVTDVAASAPAPGTPGRSSRRRSAGLALGLSGLLLLGLTALQLHARGEATRSAHSVSVSQPLEPARPSALALPEPFEPAPPSAPVALPEPVATSRPASSAPLVGAVELRPAAEATSSDVLAEAEATRAPRAAKARRTRSGDSDAELRELFFPRQRAARGAPRAAAAEHASVANEAPIFD